MPEFKPGLNPVKPEKVIAPKEIIGTNPTEKGAPALLKKERRGFTSSWQVIREKAFEGNAGSVDDRAQDEEYFKYISGQLTRFDQGIPDASEISDALAAIGFRSLYAREGLKHIAQEEQEGEEFGNLSELKGQQKAGKKLFMEMARQIYPDAEFQGISRASFARFEQKAKQLKSVFPIEDPGLVVMAARFQKENWENMIKEPRTLLANLDQMIIKCSEQAEALARQNAIDSTEEAKEQEIAGNRLVLVDLNQLIYEMELVRDQLQEKVYGRSDLSPTEEGRIDVLNDKLKQPEKNQQPVFENITDSNFEKYRNQGKEMVLDGNVWKILELTSDGEVLIERQRGIREILDQVDQGKKDGSRFMTSSMIHQGLVAFDEVKSRGQWIIEKPPRSPQDQGRQKEIEDFNRLQDRIISGEFDKNPVEKSALYKFLKEQSERFNNERQAHERILENK